ncbi:hypothetical protein BP00DRAFT_118742 [Aspergillus indologenus CBS 114.80]|uniref:Uncharacterized protein n=1 Tax=Aspergillus indologenus CBS 114.80 TaxID=1450541 RepID=A0A2V5IBY7_9EURO|nr:hypothetical protein BP00DRAFT_118742 [Aspergillus indologenus CBS 114.80]
MLQSESQPAYLYTCTRSEPCEHPVESPPLPAPVISKHKSNSFLPLSSLFSCVRVFKRVSHRPVSHAEVLCPTHISCQIDLQVHPYSTMFTGFFGRTAATGGNQARVGTAPVVNSMIGARTSVLPTGLWVEGLLAVGGVQDSPAAPKKPRIQEKERLDLITRFRVMSWD